LRAVSGPPQEAAQPATNGLREPQFDGEKRGNGWRDRLRRLEQSAFFHSIRDFRQRLALFWRRWRRRILQGTALLLIVLAALFTWAWNATPSTADLPARLRTEMAARHEPYTPYAAISPWAPKALIAIEDERFYQHHGIDIIGILRAVWDDLQARSFVEGGSTLTAQLAKNVYLNDYDHTIPLKAEDLLLAVKIERTYTKQQILEMYLNVVYFGEGAYGIGEASERFFGVPPAHLDAAQSALLAGLVQAPGAYDPWCNPAASRARQVQVLNRMLADSDLSQRQYNAALAEKFAFWQPGFKPPADSFCAA
jgi:membrane peptidoglycan carboxypeptidase